jgi:uncharacterized protein involved in response to NO
VQLHERTHDLDDECAVRGGVMSAVPAARDLDGWKFGRLFDAPHRLAFCAGALMLAASALWWAVTLVLRARGIPVRWAMAPATAHGLVMTFGFMPLFFMGFLFTAGPRWLGRAPVAAGALLPAVLPQLAGWGVFVLAVHGRDAGAGAALGAFGLGAVALGWTMTWRRFLRLLRASTVQDKTHARLVAIAGLAGVLCLWLAVAGIATQRAALVQAATLAALWGFVGLTFVAVLHRMIPFFSAAAVPVLDAWRPLWLLWLLALLVAGEAVATGLDALVSLPAAALAARAAIEAPAGLLLLALAVRWGLVQSLRIRLLAMLHLGLVWLGVAFVLNAVSHALAAASGGATSLGLAPLHAYTMGFLGSTLLAMVTRVSCGHGGRALVADDIAWRLFLLLQFAVAARVAGALPAAVVPPGTASGLVTAAALAWAGVAVAWACRYGRWYGTPRPDGRPG